MLEVSGMQEASVSRQRVRPGRWLYAVAALFLIVGVLSLVVLFRNVSGFAGDAIRVAAPGQSEITISESGKYVIAYEHRSVLDGKVITASEEVPAMNVAVLAADTKAEVPVHAYGIDRGTTCSCASMRTKRMNHRRSWRSAQTLRSPSFSSWSSGWSASSLLS
jgi:hypothetical protein